MLDIRRYGTKGCEILTLRKQNNLKQNLKGSNVHILYPVLQLYCENGFARLIRLDSITPLEFLLFVIFDFSQ